MLIAITPYFILLVLKQVNLVVILIMFNDSYAKICVPDIIKKLNLKVFHNDQELIKQGM